METSSRLIKGDLNLDSKGLDHKAFKRILTKLTSGRSQPHRKCRRLNYDTFTEFGIERQLSSETSVHMLRLSGNTEIGDKGMDYLHLIPNSVNFITLSNCELSPRGIQKLCQFLETNNTVIGVMMWGNHIDDEGAKYIAKLVEKNTSLGGLSFLDYEKCMSENGISMIAESLKKNNTLRVLELGHINSTSSDKTSLSPEQMRYLLPFEKMLEENEDSALESLIVCRKNAINDVGKKMKIKYLMDLNRFKARQVTREGASDRFHATIGKVSSKKILDVVYFLVRNNVNHLV
mmetsp:Transcript_27616/g.52351  ORF Transcript_27616/g.52351 Transcript_27616/m.52351 type:complete len:290 (-) Transcript_27616:46-915(-)